MVAYRQQTVNSPQQLRGVPLDAVTPASAAGPPQSGADQDPQVVDDHGGGQQIAGAADSDDGDHPHHHERKSDSRQDEPEIPNAATHEVGVRGYPRTPAYSASTWPSGPFTPSHYSIYPGLFCFTTTGVMALDDESVVRIPRTSRAFGRPTLMTVKPCL